jgi:hypothetical protein
MARDAQSFAVVRFVAPFCLLTVKSYYSASILVAWFTYGGIWRLYSMFVELYPRLRREFAYSTLFMPSLSFWGGGILKDTFSFWSACLFLYGFYMVFFKNGSKLKYIFLMVFMAYIMISVKRQRVSTIVLLSTSSLSSNYLTIVKNTPVLSTIPSTPPSIIIGTHDGSFHCDEVTRLHLILDSH